MGLSGQTLVAERPKGIIDPNTGKLLARMIRFSGR